MERNQGDRTMARFGISYQEVADVAQQLQAQGINPTVEAVRRATGTGSNGTIATHLRAWKAQQDATRGLVLKQNLPEELVLTMKGLWDRVTNEAQVQIQSIQQKVEEEVLELKTRSQQLAADSTRWQQQSHALKQEKDVLANDKLGLEQAVIELKKQNALLDSKSNAYAQQLQDKQDHIDELNRLHKQAQLNLEHYHASSREQRLMEQQRYEQQQHQTAQTINQLEQKLIAHRHDHTMLNEKFQQTNHEKEIIQKSNDSLQNQIDKIQIQLSQIEKEKVEKIQTLNQLQAHAQALQEKLNDQSSANNDFQKQIAVLSQQLLISQSEAKELSGQNKSLAHDKWVLGQEKAQLEGQLKQVGVLLEKRVTAG